MVTNSLVIRELLLLCDLDGSLIWNLKFGSGSIDMKSNEEQMKRKNVSTPKLHGEATNA